MDVPKNVHFLDDLAGVVGFEPTNVGFRIRCLNRTWRYPSTSGAVGETRTLMALTTATSTLRVYQFRHDREMLTVRCLRSIRRVTPLIDLAGVVGFEPTNVGFRIRCLNRTWRYPSKWCGRRDSNSHGSHHSDLNAARLPISPRPRPELFPTDVHPKKRGHQQRRCILPRNFVRGGFIRVFTIRHTIFMGCRLFDR